MKKVVVMSFLLLIGTCVYAQNKPAKSSITTPKDTDKYEVVINRFWSNCFVSVGGGGQVYFGDNDSRFSLGKRLAPALDVAVGKWFTPGMGIRLMYSGLSIKGATRELDKQKTNATNLHADVLFNAFNLFCGYDEQRLWSITPYVGFGWMAALGTSAERELNASLGLLNSYTLSPSLDLNLDARVALSNDRFDGEVSGVPVDGLVTVTVGLTYKFPVRTWTRKTTKVVREVVLDETELDDLRRKVTLLRVENNRLKAETAGKK